MSTSTARDVEHLGTALTVRALARVALRTKGASLEGTSLNCLKTFLMATGDNAEILWWQRWWCYGGDTVVLWWQRWWCYGGDTVVLWWYCGGDTVVAATVVVMATEVVVLW